jgi:hypothetical protein
MVYLIYVMFLFAGHNGLSVVIGTASCDATQSGAALNSHAAMDRRGQGGGSRGAGHPRKA